MRQRRGDRERIHVTGQMAKEMEELARHVKPLHSFLVKQGVSDGDAWDILQDSFIKVLNRQGPLPECLEKRRAILFGEVSMQMKAYFTERGRLLHRAARAQEFVVVMGLTEQRDMADVLEARQLLEMLLSEISPEQCQVFTDKVLDQLTIREISERLRINEHTTRTHWFRALEALKEKLDTIDRRGGRGLMVFVIVAGLLGLARNAWAMVEMLKRLFRSIRFLRGNILAGVATASLVLLSPPNSGASGRDASSSSRNQASASASEGIPKPTPGMATSVPEKLEIAALPSIANTLATSVPGSNSRRGESEKQAKRVPPPDYLLVMAMVALRHGHPEKALARLDQYVAADAKAANTGVVKTLRAEAQMAMSARGK